MGASLEDPDKPVRQDVVQQAIKFLSNPHVGSGNTEVKIAFMKHKGLSEKEIKEALKLSSGPIIGSPRK